jgi:hypothetical protein
MLNFKVLPENFLGSFAPREASENWKSFPEDQEQREQSS